MISDRERSGLTPDALRLLDVYQREQYPALLNEVDELSKAGPLGPEILGLAGLTLAALERYAEARKAAGAAVERAPGQAWLYGVVAVTEAGLGHQSAAVDAQRRAVQLMPGEPAYGAKLARYLREAGQGEQAMRAARQALVIDGTHAGALNELGLSLQAVGDTAGALEQFRLARAAQPDEPAGYVNEGALHLREGARSEARRVLREALRRRPGLEEAENLMADSLTGAGGVGRAMLSHLLTLARVTLVGWLMIAFLYYLLFRLLQFIWRAAPVTLPVAQGLLIVTLIYLIGGMAAGKLLRSLFRKGWPH